MPASRRVIVIPAQRALGPAEAVGTSVCSAGPVDRQRVTTVERHLSSAYQKLGIRSRFQIATAIGE